MSEAFTSCQVLTFKLADEIFAVDIEQVREIIDFDKSTKVPSMPEYIRGVINLRGNVVPVVDLRLKFGMPATSKTVDTCIIIIEMTVENEIIIFGALADSVQEVVDFEADVLEPAPKIGTRFNTEFIKSMAKMGDEFVIILNIENVFTIEEIKSINES